MREQDDGFTLTDQWAKVGQKFRPPLVARHDKDPVSGALVR
jgi:hypothetical protein